MPNPRHVMLAIAATGLFAAVAPAQADADTPPFPNFSGYATVNPSDYLVDTSTPGHTTSGTYFRTPDGVVCAIDDQPSGAGCSGENLPAIPPPANTYGGALVSAIDTWRGIGTTNAPVSQGGKVHGNPVRTLPPLHVLTVDGVTCGVDDHGTTACRDGRGGAFVMSPGGSGFLPRA